MNFSTYGANAFLAGTAMPATLWVQAHIGNPSAAGTANVAGETARKSFTRAVPSAGATSNAAIIEWLNATANEDWTHLTLWDASSAGNCWAVGLAPNGPVTVAVGNTVQIDIGDLDMAVPIWS